MQPAFAFYRVPPGGDTYRFTAVLPLFEMSPTLGS